MTTPQDDQARPEENSAGAGEAERDERVEEIRRDYQFISHAEANDIHYLLAQLDEAREHYDAVVARGAKIARAYEDLEQQLDAAREREEALFDALKHGDIEHQNWLCRAIIDHFDGKEVERPRGKGTTEALQAENEKLKTLLHKSIVTGVTNEEEDEILAMLTASQKETGQKPENRTQSTVHGEEDGS